MKIFVIIAIIVTTLFSQDHSIGSQTPEDDRHPIISDDIQMAIAIHENDKDHIAHLLDKNISKIQKIEAFYRLHDLKRAESEIFSLENPSSSLYHTYLNLLIESVNFIAYEIDIREGLYINRIKIQNRPYQLEMKTVNDRSQEVIISTNILRYQIDVGYEKSQNSSPSLNIAKKFKRDRLNGHYFIAYHKNEINSIDTVTKQVLNIKRDMIGFHVNIGQGVDHLLIEMDYSKNYFKGATFYRLFTQCNYAHTYTSHLVSNLYLKQLSYSSYLISSHEVGGNLLITTGSNRSKKPKYFLSPTLLYNDQIGFGYNIIFGFDKRVIKADNVELMVGIGSIQNELKVTYTYYY
ncbi:MAG: hypothetical protein DSY46_07125 [Hydrogenimonas sp.]|nr:MAG: hypothetical protein DSY46_07125 [Hydrogenimonas sp.]